jgi:hypothetical protein
LSKHDSKACNVFGIYYKKEVRIFGHLEAKMDKTRHGATARQNMYVSEIYNCQIGCVMRLHCGPNMHKHTNRGLTR